MGVTRTESEGNLPNEVTDKDSTPEHIAKSKIMLASHYILDFKVELY